MADRDWPNSPRTQGVEHVYLPAVILPNGNSAPTLSEGDPNGSYYTITRNSAGNMTLKTKDPFLAVVHWEAEVTTGAKVKLGLPVQNTDNTWSIPIYTTGDTNAVALGAATVSAGGSGYTSAPAITYNNAHGNTGLKGTVTIGAGAVTAITITEGGFGTDLTAPTITLTGGGGSSATGTVALGTGTAQDIPAGTAKIVVHMVFRNSSVKP